MGGDLEQEAHDGDVTGPPSNRRILVLMAVIGIAVAVAGAIYGSLGFGAGILAGTALSFVNYVWLKRSLAKIFSAAAAGEKPRMLAAGYFLRYAVMAAVIAAIYVSGIVPIASVLIGLAMFAFAVVLEGFIRIFSGIFNNKEI